VLFDTTPTPLISGTTTVGQTLTAAPGLWAPVADSFTYRWKRGAVTIVGATTSTYTLQAADLGQVITVTVAARKSGYVAVPQTSLATATVAPAVFTSTPTPVITGSAVVDQRLRVTTGTWAPAGTLARVWKRGGVPISGATGTSYVVVAADVGAKITVEVTATKAGYTAVEKTSLETATVVVASFTTASTPTISGTMTVGQKLSVVTGLWAPSARFTCVWMRNGVAIPGAVNGIYTLAAADMGTKISVALTGTRAGYQTTAHTSVETVAVAGETFATAPTPTITGTTTVGQRLRTVVGTWSKWANFSYVWTRNGEPIPGATGGAYTLTAADKGAVITFEITASRPGFVTAVRTSAATDAVAGIAFTTASTPTITGTTRVGKRLSAHTGSWSQSAVVSFVWKRDGTVIEGATAVSYTLAPADVGARITVEVTGSRLGYATTVRPSAETNVIAP
jgi:hypothetical protein